MRQNRYTMAALDMDDTLLMPDKTIHPDTIRDINLASERGVEVVYCSGRAVAELRPYTQMLPAMRYAVCMSGAVVYDFAKDRPLFVRAIRSEHVGKILETAETYRGMLHFLTETESIVSEEELPHLADFHRAEYQETFDKTARGVPSMREELKRHEAIPKVNIYFRSPSDRERAMKDLLPLPVTSVYTGLTALEMTAENVTKAAGLALLCGHLGIGMEEVMGVGDSLNDLDFLKAVGLPVAMGNSVPEILQICEAVTGDNLRNGAGAAIRRFCLSD